MQYFTPLHTPTSTPPHKLLKTPIPQHPYPTTINPQTPKRHTHKYTHTMFPVEIDLVLNKLCFISNYYHLLHKRKSAKT